MDIARSKYEYEPTNDDITFALLLIDFSIRTLFDEGATGTALTATLTSIFGRDRTTDARNRMRKLTDALTSKRGNIELKNSEAFIGYLTGASALMAQYVAIARKDKAKGSAKVTAFKRKLDARKRGGSINTSLFNLTNQLVKDARAEIAKIP